MDLMKGSTSFRSLRKKYDDFSAPSVEVTVGSTKLVSGAGADIFDLELELTSGFEASGCVFYIDGAYDEKNTDFKKFTDKIQIGESVEIALGYVRRESVFKGYINEVEYQYGMEDDRNRIRVECMDAKGLLIHDSCMMQFYLCPQCTKNSHHIGETKTSPEAAANCCHISKLHSHNMTY